MQIHLDIQQLQPPPGNVPVVAAMGVFDGLHIAHQQIIRASIARAKEIHGQAMVFTFKNYPIEHFRPDLDIVGLTPWPLRMALLEEMGVERVCAPPFDARLADIRADRFVHDILRAHLGVTHVFVGFNFCYGRNREGTSETLLSEKSRAFEDVCIIDAVEHDGAPVSSTRARQAVLAGELETAWALLGRPYALYGPVIHGDARGAGLGIPTANIEVRAQPLPPPGIFGVRAILEDGRTLFGLTYIGSAPTFRRPDASIRVETFLLGDPGDLYGSRMLIELLTRVRDESQFSGAEDLVAQIRRDETEFRNWLRSQTLPAATPIPAVPQDSGDSPVT